MNRPLRVLLVEDSASDAKLVVHHLRQQCTQLHFERVEDAGSFRKALVGSEWDVILCDWSLPTFSAYAALRIVKEIGIDLPFIILSGTIGEETAVEAMRAGAHDYVLKGNLIRLTPAIERELRDRAVREEQRQSERVYRWIVEASHDGIAIQDAKDHLSFVNRRMEQILGCDPGELLGKDLSDFVREEGKSILAQSDDPLRQEALKRHASSFTRKDGSEVFVLLQKSPMTNEAGRFSGTLVLVTDITERKRAEDLQKKSLTEHERLLAAIRELSSPVLWVHQSVLLLPIIGELDSARVACMYEKLLAHVASEETRAVILDLTGLASVDMTIVEMLITMARAVQFLGSHVILCGMSSAVARTAVNIGADFSAFILRGELHAALTTARQFVDERVATRKRR